jgi:hypothetical protein
VIFFYMLGKLVDMLYTIPVTQDTIVEMPSTVADMFDMPAGQRA